MIQRDVKLWLGQSGSNVYLPVSQFDSMWQFVFTIYDGSTEWTIPQGAEIVLNGLKPDGNTFSFRGAISNNTVVVDGDVQMTAVAGSTKCELSIMSGGKVVGTANFILSVEAAPKAPGDISSETTLPAYAEILDEIAQILAGGGGGGGSYITVDNSLSPTSTNPVQNRAIKEAIDAVTRYAANNLSYFSGGTTGQVLTKASSSSLDFTWTTPSSGSGTITISETGDPPNRWLIINDGTNTHYVPLKASDTGGGKVSAYALPDATTSVKGAMTAADKTKLDGLTGIPAGGSIGQVLAKASGTDKDVTWITPSGGGGSVNDVTVAGTSVVSSGIAAIPSAESNTWGVVKVAYTIAASPSDVPRGSINFGSNSGFDFPVLNPGRKLVNGYLNLDSSITFNGPNPVTGGAIYTALNGKISAPSSPTTGQVLVYNGTEWVAGSASTGAFYAVYGTTTNAEIEAAYQAGKAIFCIYDNETIIPLATRTDANEVTFVGVVSTDVIISLSCFEDDWNNSSLSLTSNGLGFFIRPSERTVSTAGDVTAQIDNREIVHFTGQLSSLTITFSSSTETGVYPYHFDFTTDSLAPTLTLPQSVKLPDGFSVEANKRYEVDILNNYASIQSWTVS